MTFYAVRRVRIAANTYKLLTLEASVAIRSFVTAMIKLWVLRYAARCCGLVWDAHHRLARDRNQPIHHVCK